MKMSEVGETEQKGDYRGLRSKSRLKATSKQVAQPRISGQGKQSEKGGRWHPRDGHPSQCTTWPPIHAIIICYITSLLVYCRARR